MPDFSEQFMICVSGFEITYLVSFKKEAGILSTLSNSTLSFESLEMFEDFFIRYSFEFKLMFAKVHCLLL